MRTSAIVLVVVGLLVSVSQGAVMNKAVWLFDGNANDSENGYDGAENGTVNYVADHPSPPGGTGYDYAGNQALSLNASGYVRVDSDPVLTPGSGVAGGLDFLVQFWMKTSSNSADMRMIYFAQTTPHTPHNWQIAMGSGTVNILSNDGNWDTVSSTGTVNDGEWHHIVYTNDGAANTIYIDGVFNNSAPAGRIRSNYGAGYPFDFGKQSGGAPSYIGLLDEVRVSGVTPGEAFPDPMGLYLNSLVPEPASLTVLGLGALGLIARKRK